MKIDRLLSIVLLMLQRKKVTAPELASYFETSVRTIYRDIDTLCLAGVPVFSEQGAGGGYSLMEGFTLDKQFFKPEEILVLLAGLRGMEDVFGDKNITQTIDKVNTLGSHDDSLKPVDIDLFGWGNSSSIKDSVRSIYGAISEKRILSFSYSNLKGETSFRSVEPYKIFFKSANWYLMGFCLKRSDYRFFKISRARDLTVKEDCFVPRDHSELSRSESWGTNQAGGGEEIEFIIDQTGASKAREFFGDDLEELEDGSVRVLVVFPIDEWVYSYFLGFGSSLTLIKPIHLRDELVRRAEEFVKKNKTLT